MPSPAVPQRHHQDGSAAEGGRHPRPAGRAPPDGAQRPEEEEAEQEEQVVTRRPRAAAAALPRAPPGKRSVNCPLYIFYGLHCGGIAAMTLDWGEKVGDI